MRSTGERSANRIEPDRQWFGSTSAWGCYLYIPSWVSSYIANENAAVGAARGLAFLYLLIWYFSAGRAQAKYVKGKFASDYPRRAWSKPLLIGVAAMVGYITVAWVIGFIIGIIQV